jgi:hypothetical protein
MQSWSRLPSAHAATFDTISAKVLSGDAEKPQAAWGRSDLEIPESGSAAPDQEVGRRGTLGKINDPFPNGKSPDAEAIATKSTCGLHEVGQLHENSGSVSFAGRNPHLQIAHRRLMAGG